MNRTGVIEWQKSITTFLSYLSPLTTNFFPRTALVKFP